jgi:hypothetical protein
MNSKLVPVFLEVKHTTSIISGRKMSFFIMPCFLFSKTSFSHLENTPVQINIGFIACHVFDNIIIDIISTTTLGNQFRVHILFTLTVFAPQSQHKGSSEPHRWHNG